MTTQGEVRDSHSDLKEAIASGALSEPLRLRAADIVNRIERPVRLAALGLPGSGKSMLLTCCWALTSFLKACACRPCACHMVPKPRRFAPCRMAAPKRCPVRT